MNKLDIRLRISLSILRSELLEKIYNAKIVDFESHQINIIKDFNQKIEKAPNDFMLLEFVDLEILLRDTLFFLNMFKQDYITLSLRKICKILNKIISKIKCKENIYKEIFIDNILKFYFDDLIDVSREIIGNLGIEVSEWKIEKGFCAKRVITSKDYKGHKNIPIAYIENNPKVMIGKNKFFKNGYYIFGNKVEDGLNGHIPENELYGFHKPSREWCDEILRELGYILPVEENK